MNNFYPNIIDFNYSFYGKNKYLCKYYEIIYILNLLLTKNSVNYVENIKRELNKMSMRDLYIYNSFLSKKKDILSNKLDNININMNNIRQQLLQNYNEQLNIELNILKKEYLDLEIKIKLINNKLQIIKNYVQIKNIINNPVFYDYINVVDSKEYTIDNNIFQINKENYLFNIKDNFYKTDIDNYKNKDIQNYYTKNIANFFNNIYHLEQYDSINSTFQHIKQNFNNSSIHEKLDLYWNIVCYEIKLRDKEIDELIFNENSLLNKNEKIIMDNYLSELLIKNEKIIMNNYLSEISKDKNYNTNNNKKIFLLDELNNDNISLYRILSNDIVVFNDENFNFLFEDIRKMENYYSELKDNLLIRNLLYSKENQIYKEIIELYHRNNLINKSKNLFFYEDKFYKIISHLQNYLNLDNILRLNNNIFINTIEKLIYSIYNMSKNNGNINRIIYYFIFFYEELKNEKPNFKNISDKIKYDYVDNKTNEYIYKNIIVHWNNNKRDYDFVSIFYNNCNLKLYTEEIINYKLSMELSISNYKLKNYYYLIKKYFSDKSIRDLVIHKIYLSNINNEIKNKIKELKNNINQRKINIYLNNVDIHNEYLELTEEYMKKKNKKKNIIDLINIINVHINNIKKNLEINEDYIVDYINITDNDINDNIDLYNNDNNNKNNILIKSNFTKNQIDNYKENISIFYTKEIKDFFNNIHDFNIMCTNITSFMPLTNIPKYKKMKLSIYNEIIKYEKNNRILEAQEYSKNEKYDKCLNINTIIY